MMAAATFMAAPAAPAAQVPSEVRYLGDDRVVVSNWSCYDWETNCGPVILVEPDEVFDDDVYVDTAAWLWGPSGSLTVSNSNFNVVNDDVARQIDPGFGGYTGQWRAATAMATTPGRYTLKLHWEQPGHWSCSQFNPNGCSWRDEIDATRFYSFTWTGSALTAFPVRTPSAPVKKAAKAGKTKVSLAWAAPNYRGPAITAYVVQKGSTVRRLVGTASSYTWRSLKPGKKYTFRVRAANLVGWGTWTTITVRTKR